MPSLLGAEKLGGQECPPSCRERAKGGGAFLPPVSIPNTKRRAGAGNDPTAAMSFSPSNMIRMQARRLRSAAPCVSGGFLPPGSCRRLFQQPDSCPCYRLLLTGRNAHSPTSDAVYATRIMPVLPFSTSRYLPLPCRNVLCPHPHKSSSV